jgi:hypothetical protein
MFMEVAEACTGVHIMVESHWLKSVCEDGGISQKYHVYLLTNCETFWYPTTEKPINW